MNITQWENLNKPSLKQRKGNKVYKATITYTESNKVAKLEARDEHLQTLLNIITCWDDIHIVEIHIIKEKGG